MPLKKYGVLKGSVVSTLAGADDDHYQIKVKAGSQFFRIAVNVKSQAAPSEVMYYVDEDFQWSGLAKLKKLADGFTKLPSKSGGKCQISGQSHRSCCGRPRRLRTLAWLGSEEHRLECLYSRDKLSSVACE